MEPHYLLLRKSDKARLDWKEATRFIVGVMTLWYISDMRAIIVRSTLTIAMKSVSGCETLYVGM